MFGKKTRKSFNVFEAGSGKRPIGLVKQAAKAKKRKLRARKFEGVDIQKVNLNQLLKKTGHKTIPTNLKVRQQCAVKTMKMLKPNSQHLIFSSYLLNVLTAHQPSKNPLPTFVEFFISAKRALKPGGRLVLVQDRVSILLIKKLAENVGLTFFKKALSDTESAKSPAKFIRLRSTPQKRTRMIKKELESGRTQVFELAVIMNDAKVASPEQLFEPTILIMQKPRKGKKKIQTVTELSSEFETDLAEFETDLAIKSALNEILR